MKILDERLCLSKALPCFPAKGIDCPATKMRSVAHVSCLKRLNPKALSLKVDIQRKRLEKRALWACSFLTSQILFPRFTPGTHSLSKGAREKGFLVPVSTLPLKALDFFSLWKSIIIPGPDDTRDWVTEVRFHKSEVILHCCRGGISVSTWLCNLERRELCSGCTYWSQHMEGSQPLVRKLQGLFTVAPLSCI